MPVAQESHVNAHGAAPANSNGTRRIDTDETENKSSSSQSGTTLQITPSVVSEHAPQSWAFWNTIAGLGTFISALATLVIAWFTYRAAKIAGLSANAANKATELAERSIEVARESYTASERPWVSVKAQIKSDLVRSEVGINFSISFDIKNHGLSPARNVHIFYKPVTLKVGQDQFGNARENVYELGKSGAGSNMGIQLFPSEESVICWQSPLTNDEIQDGAKSHADHNQSLPAFYIIGSVFYQSVFSEKLYHTDFIYYVVATGNPKFPKGSDVPNFAHRFPVDKLRLESVPYYKGTIG